MAEGRSLEPVRAYYDARGESELHRLDNPYEGVVEREIHRRAFEAAIPSRARVLDLGGGPGHWSIWLARRGHQVVLADISPRMLELAREQFAAAEIAPEAILEMDARDLSHFAGGEFDAVLALGPFYHLVEAADRARAASEIHRVLRPGGLLFATVMIRYSWLIAMILEGGADRLTDAERLLETGVYRNHDPGRFTEAYLHRPEEVAPFFEQNGFETVGLTASQSFLNLVQEQVAELHQRDPNAYEALLDMAHRSAGDPAVRGLSGHLLYQGSTAPTGDVSDPNREVIL